MSALVWTELEKRLGPAACQAVQKVGWPDDLNETAIRDLCRSNLLERALEKTVLKDLNDYHKILLMAAMAALYGGVATSSLTPAPAPDSPRAGSTTQASSHSSPASTTGRKRRLESPTAIDIPPTNLALQPYKTGAWLTTKSSWLDTKRPLGKLIVTAGPLEV